MNNAGDSAWAVACEGGHFPSSSPQDQEEQEAEAEEQGAEKQHGYLECFQAMKPNVVGAGWLLVWRLGRARVDTYTTHG